jgi:hypothetical protein
MLSENFPNRNRFRGVQDAWNTNPKGMLRVTHPFCSPMNEQEQKEWDEKHVGEPKRIKSCLCGNLIVKGMAHVMQQTIRIPPTGSWSEGEH